MRAIMCEQLFIQIQSTTEPNPQAYLQIMLYLLVHLEKKQRKVHNNKISMCDS